MLKSGIMRKKISVLLTLGISLTFLASTAYAQKFSKKNRYQSIGASLNAMNYVGDVDPSSNMWSPALRLTKLNVGVDYIYRYGPHTSLRASFSYGRIAGDDQKSSSRVVTEDVGRYERNLSFRNDIKELKADVIYDVFGNKRGLQRRVHFTPYFFTGVAVYHHAPKAKYNGDWIDLQKVGTEGQNLSDDVKSTLAGVGKSYSKFRVSVPLGVGFRYKISKMWDLSFEIGWRYTFFDYLDDIGETQYISLAKDNHFDKSLLGGPNDLAVILHDRSVTSDITTVTTDAKGYQYSNSFAGGTNAGVRGNSEHDWYIVTGFHLTYIFHPRVICPKYRG